MIARGKMIDGQPYPYSPSLAGAKNKRALLDDAMAAVPTRRRPGIGLLATSKPHNRAIKKMKDEGWLIEEDMKELMSDPGRFRKGRGLRVDRARTPWPSTAIMATRQLQRHEGT